LLAIVLAAAVGGYFLLRDDLPAAGSREGAARMMSELMSGKGPVGGPFTLVDQSGARRSLADFRGKLVLLYFGFTYCPDVCPTDLMAVGNLVRSLGPAGDQVQPVFVTLDPARDTPEVLRAYVASFHPRFVALTGTENEIRHLIQGVFREGEATGHQHLPHRPHGVRFPARPRGAIRHPVSAGHTAGANGGDAARALAIARRPR
jgi:cytochrome oxidase Cu insertion factor (SCO1/SenC/PrrC family)